MEQEKKEIKEIMQEQKVSPETEEIKQTKYELVVCSKKGNVQKRYVLEDGKEIIAGAMTECDVFVDDEYLSSKHFSIKLNAGKIEVKDLGSKNGLYLLLDNVVQVNGGSSLLAGKTIFKVEECKDA